MMRDAPILAATPWTRLPEQHRWSGAPSPWARMTRPGRAMHSFLEGAFIGADGALWLSDVPYGRVFSVSSAGAWRLEHDYAGAPHAMRHSPDGRTVAVDYDHGLIALSGRASFELLSAGPDGDRFRGLSDMCVAPDGAVWFTDSGRSSLADPSGALYRWTADGALRRMAARLPYPNGVAASPDGAWIYVAMTRANAVWRLSGRGPGVAEPMIGVFLNLSGGLGPDGLATNALGWLAVAQAQAGRAYVVDALGDPVAEIRIAGGAWTTSVAFDPDDPRRLFVVDAEDGALHIAHLPEGPAHAP